MSNMCKRGHETCEKEEYIVYNQIGTPNLPHRHKVRRALFKKWMKNDVNIPIYKPIEWEGSVTHASNLWY